MDADVDNQFLTKPGEREKLCEIYDIHEDNTSMCYSYKKNICKCMLFYFLVIVTLGFLLLVTYWKPEWKLYLTHSRCILSEADNVYLIDQFGTVFVEKVEVSTTSPWKRFHDEGNHYLQQQQHSGEQSYRYFYYRCLKYYYHMNSKSYIEVDSLEDKVSLYVLNKIPATDLLTSRKDELSWFGPNVIDVKVKSYFTLFFQECADPFYIFQLFSCILWFSDTYYYYAAAIVFISVTSIVISIYQTRKHLVTLQNMISKSGKVTILNGDGNECEVDSRDLVPGDVLVIPKNGCALLCDAALVSGNAIVNESMLTGESIPVTKTPVPNPMSELDSANEPYNSMKFKRHTLFCGTHVLQTRYFEGEKVLAVVVKTGFTTMKGSLIRSILYPKAVDFKFFTDALKFVGVLAIFALIGLIYTIYVFYMDGASIGMIIKRALDVITIAVPPALPAAMSVGTVYALQRLKKKNIFCISPSRVNMSGRLNLFCFDKTGTLTEDGLDFCGIIPYNGGRFNDLQESVNLRDNNKFTIGMASCHSLTIINGEVTGDPLDMKMFQATEWEIEESSENETERYGHVVPTVVRPKANVQDSIRIKYLEDKSLPMEVAVLKQFTFSSDLQRMSVIVRMLGARNMDIYVKGSPEMIASLCKKESIPNNFEECLVSYTKQGYRVLALSYKPLPSSVQWHKVQHFSRDQAECELEFLGFIIMKNLLKPVSSSVIKELHLANIRTVMVTGDNILTAISVARECGMVNPSEKIISINITDDVSSSGSSDNTGDNTDKNSGSIDVNSESTDYRVDDSNISPAKKLQYNIVGEIEHTMDGVTLDSHIDYYEKIGSRIGGLHFAVTGKVFAHISKDEPELYDRLLAHGTIFARMLPDQKTQLIEGLQELEYSVGMCGDGANDCGALKRANTGVSLSETEASVASPFTSKVPNISCVVNVVKEGRCALVTSFNIFKYMALYSMIQYSSVLLLYSTGANLGDLQYLYIDLFTIMPLAITMSRTEPSDDLVARRPLGRLVHPIVLFSLITQVLVQTGFQVLIFFYVRSLPEYEPLAYFVRKLHVGDPDHAIVSYETTALFTYSSYQYVMIALIFSVGRPFRKPFYTNVLLILSCVCLLVMTTVLTIRPASALQTPFQILGVGDTHYYYVSFGVLLCNLLVSVFIDNCILEMQCVQRVLRRLQGAGEEDQSKYFKLKDDLKYFERLEVSR